MKSDRLLEEIKERIDIVDFISEYVQLRKSGQNWKGLCPFHSEKTPSFMVSPSKQIFHCFGCNAGGDVIRFLMEYERMPFPEALQVLAQKAGVQLKTFRQDPRAQKKDELVRNALRDAATFFALKIKTAKAAADYIRKRGITRETEDIFRLGYAPAGWHNLLQYLRSKGYGDAVVREAGLAVAGEKGLYDMFRDRIVFPIMGMQGDVIAFGGRALDNSLPKYLNSPETEVFKKSETLYGLFTAKEAIRRQERVFLVEGYMDVIICHQFGIRNVVAPLGTSLTGGHLRKLRRLVREAVVVFDGDSAGIAAARRAIPLLLQNDFHAWVLLLPDGEDPDSYLRKHGSESFGVLAENAQPVIEFLLRSSKGRRSDAVREAISVVSEMSDTIAADRMLSELSRLTASQETHIREEFRKLRAKKIASGPTQSRIQGKRGAEELLLSAMIAFPEKTRSILDRVSRDDFKDRTVADLVGRISSAGDKFVMEAVLKDASVEERNLFTKLSVDPGFDLEYVDRNIDDCCLAIERRKVEERHQQAHASGDPHLIHQLIQEKKKFIKGRGHERLQ